MDDKKIKISIRNLYKVFGDNPEVALQQVKEGMSKSELLEKHNHVLGLNDINVDVLAGKTTVIMGLSGSGKSTLIRHLNRLIEPTAGEVWVDMQMRRAGGSTVSGCRGKVTNIPISCQAACSSGWALPVR